MYIQQNKNQMRAISILVAHRGLLSMLANIVIFKESIQNNFLWASLWFYNDIS